MTGLKGLLNFELTKQFQFKKSLKKTYFLGTHDEWLPPPKIGNKIRQVTEEDMPWWNGDS